MHIFQHEHEQLRGSYQLRYWLASEHLLLSLILIRVRKTKTLATRSISLLTTRAFILFLTSEFWSISHIAMQRSISKKIRES